MSDYSDCYYDLHKGEINRERTAGQYREKMINELPADEMIKLMFTSFIKTKGVTDVVELGEKYFKE